MCVDNNHSIKGDIFLADGRDFLFEMKTDGQLDRCFNTG